jgi:ribonuclease HII
MEFSRLTVSEVGSWIQAQAEIYPDVLKQLALDSRSGVRRVVEQYQRRLALLEVEKQRIYTLHQYERDQRQNGFQLIAGVDEAGRGPLAGPVVAAAVILPPDIHIPVINDSKKLLPEQRDALFDVICREAICYGIGIVDHHQIDRINILQATYQAMFEAVNGLEQPPHILLNDAVRIPQITDIPQVAIVRGDSLSISIAAASILAKVTRDRLMEQYDVLYPAYGFGKHKGYFTPEHQQALKCYGPSPIHRRSFAPVLEAEEGYCAG